jgi:hypothetical protein
LENFFNQVINVDGFHEVRQTEIQTAEPFVPKTSLVEVKNATGKLKRYKSPGNDQIPGEVIKAGGETLRTVSDCNNYQRIYLFPTA